MKPNKNLAKTRIDELFKEAETASEAYADRYVDLALKLAQKAQISVPTPFRRMYCHKCYKYGKTASRRVKDHVLIVRCKYCDNIDRYPFS